MSVSRLQLLAFSQISVNSGMLVEEHLFCSAAFDVDFLSKCLCVDHSGSCAKKCIEFRLNLMTQYLNIAKNMPKTQSNGTSRVQHLLGYIFVRTFNTKILLQGQYCKVPTVKVY